MIQLTRSGVVKRFSSGQMEKLRLEFRQRQVVRLPQFLEPFLLKVVLGKLRSSGFRKHDSFYQEDILVDLAKDDFLDTMLTFVFNNPTLFRVIEFITDGPPLKSCVCTVHRLDPGGRHSLPWHSDAFGVASMSINLSMRPYEGGLFQIKRRGSKQLLAELSNNRRAGDAILLKVSPELVHRNTPVKGSRPKIWFAAGFCTTDCLIYQLR